MMQHKSATLRQAQGKLRRNCSMLKRTLNGASQQKLNSSNVACLIKKIPHIINFK